MNHDKNGPFGPRFGEVEQEELPLRPVYNGSNTFGGDGVLLLASNPALDGAITTTANGSGIATVSKLKAMLETATSIEDMRLVENLAQRAREFAKAAGLSREPLNLVARVALDARRRVGETLKAMKERGELAEQGKNRIYHAGIYTLGDLGLTPNESSRYQQEASVPAERYEHWANRVTSRRDGALTAAGLRALDRQLSEPDGRDDPPSPFPEAASRIRRLVARLAEWMDGGGRASLPELLGSLAGRYEGENALFDRSNEGTRP